MKFKFAKQGFTLIELLVVISIISLLSSVVLVSVNSAREKAKIAVAKSDLHQLQIAMQMFFNDKGELPPMGDICSACTLSCSSDWNFVVTTLVSGGYLSARIDRDPWGGYYCYDDNYRVATCVWDSPLWSMGPNGYRDTAWSGPWPFTPLTTFPTTFLGDDIGIIIEGPQC